MNINEEYKQKISEQIKKITMEDVENEMNKLIEIGKNANIMSSRCRTGNNIVDFFTFKERLETKGKYDVNFYEFIERIDEFKNKKFIQTMLTYYKNVKNKNGKKNEYVVYKEVYNICISAINIMRPLNCMDIFVKYKSNRVLNCCAGWGGSAVAASALNLNAYYGIDVNKNLKEPYDKLVAYLKTKSATYFDVHICDAINVDYSKLSYDTVFSSPPYYFIEKYPNSNKYNSKKEMEEKFYKPLFTNTYNGLQNGGHYIINICKEIYEKVLKKMLGEAHESFPLKKSKRQNDYTEMVYVWVKNI